MAGAYPIRGIFGNNQFNGCQSAKKQFLNEGDYAFTREPEQLHPDNRFLRTASPCSLRLLLLIRVSGLRRFA
jgi:hypothetical protein